MSSDFSTDPRQALEVSLTALVLGELRADQAEFLRRAMAQDPELARTYERLRQTIDLVQETEKTPAQQPSTSPEPLKLSEVRRQELLQHFKAVAPKEFEKPPSSSFRWLVPVGIAAVFLLLAGSLLLPAWSRAKSKGYAALADRAARGSPVVTAVSSETAAKLFQERLPTLPSIAPAASELETLHVKPKIVLPSMAQDKKAEASTEVNGAFGGFAANSPVLPAENAAKLAEYPPGLSLGLENFAGPTIAPAKAAPMAQAGGFFYRAPTAPEVGEKLSIQESLPAVTLRTENVPPSSLAAPQGATPAEAMRRRYGLARDDTPGGPTAVQQPLGERQLAETAGNLKLAHQTESRGKTLVSAESAPASQAAGVGEQLEGATRELKQSTKQVLIEPRLLETTENLKADTDLNRLQDERFKAAEKAKDTEATKGLGNVDKAWSATTTLRGFYDETERVPILGDRPLIGKVMDGAAIDFVPQAGSKAGKEKVPAAPAATPAPPAPSTREPQLSLGVAMASPGIVVTNAVAQLDQAALGRELTDSVEARGKVELSKDEGRSEPRLNARAARLDGSKAGVAATSNLPAPGSNGIHSLNIVGYVNVPVQSALRSTEPAASSTDMHSYEDAKRRLEELQRFRQTVTLKMEAEKTDLKLPKSKMVEIVDRADAKSNEAPGFGARLRRAITGGVEKKARISLERASSDVSGLSLASSGTFDPYFVLTEKEVIQSDAVLGKVVDDLKLGEDWGRKAGRSEPLSKADAVQHLKSMLDVKEVPNSSLVDIGVKSNQSEEAAKLANAVAEKYQDYRNEERTRLTMGGIEALQKRLSETEKQTALAQANVDRLQQKVASKSADEPPGTPAVPPPVPQPEVQAADNAFSTFSLNVSDVSFKTAAASLEKGLMPEPGGIRSEEFINAFDYRDPEPAAGMPVGFCWDRARYPFAQNRDVLRFALKTASQGRSASQPLNMVLLLDNSGSMERADRVRIIREALKVLAAELQPQDKLSVVTFARTAQLRVDGVAGNQAGEKLSEISELTPEGGTNLEEAMNVAYQTALKHYLPNGINRVVLLTDGAANLGDVQPENLKKKVEEHRKQGIALDCFGIGWEGYNDDLLETLTRNGDGRYGFINTPEEAATEFAPQLAGVLHVAASDVKVQVEFNPKRITAWRQIGYAKHQLTKEQFRDNTVDAAEIGAAESGNALYIVEVNPAGEGPLGTVRIRYKVPGTSDYHEHEWTVPYNGSATALERSSAALKLATAASAFSEWLAASPYATEISTEALLRYVSGVPEVYGADPRPKKLEWMVRQAASLTGK